MLDRFPQHAAIDDQQAQGKQDQAETAPERAVTSEQPDDRGHERQGGKVQVTSRHQHQQCAWQTIGWQPRQRDERQREQRRRGADAQEELRRARQAVGEEHQPHARDHERGHVQLNALAPQRDGRSMAVPRPHERRQVLRRQPRHSDRRVVDEDELNQKARERDAASREKPRQRGAKLFAEAPEIRKERERDDRARPDAKRRMDGRGDAKQDRASPIPAGAERGDDEHAQGEANDAIGMLGADEEKRIDDPVLDRTCKEDQRGGADRQEDVAAQRVDHHGERLEREHAEHAADDERELQLAESREKSQREHVVQRRPEFGVVDVEDVVGRIRHESRHDLRGLDGHLPVWISDHPHAKAEDAADDEDPERAGHARKYVRIRRATPRARRFPPAFGRLNAKTRRRVLCLMRTSVLPCLRCEGSSSCWQRPWRTRRSLPAPMRLPLPATPPGRSRCSAWPRRGRSIRPPSSEPGSSSLERTSSRRRTWSTRSCSAVRAIPAIRFVSSGTSWRATGSIR